MDVAWTAFVAAVWGGFAIWGFAGPAIDLRRRGELRPNALVASYAWHVRSIPRAVVRSLWGGLRHPWKWDGPTGIHVVMVVFFLLVASIAVIRVVVGPDRGGALAWTPLFLLTGVGLGILLVRETPGLNGRTDVGPMPPPAKHRKSG